MENERGRLIDGVVGPVTIENFGALQAACAAVDEITDGDRRTAVG